eukprot:TCONS_00034216-protein
MPLKLGRSNRYSADKLFTCHIKLLDSTIIDINIPQAAKGKECLEKVAGKLGLHEVDFFGLQYLSKKDKLHWVELDKCLRKQLDRHVAHKGRDAMLVLRIQYFAVSLDTIQQEITRYLYYLQLKSMILLGKLNCDLPIALKLAGLAVQAELGDQQTVSHCAEKIAEFHLIPNNLITKRNYDEINKEITEYHAENRGLKPADAERQYIETCQKLDQYGIQFFQGKDKDGSHVDIGAGYHGIKILYTDTKKIKKFVSWSDVGKMAFNRQNFVVSNSSSGESLSTQMEDMDIAKYLWKICVGQHQFFRMSHASGRKAFRTQFEMSTDSTLFLKVQQQTQTIKRKMTLTRKKAKEKHLNQRMETSSNGSPSPSDFGMHNVIPVFDDTVDDDTEFLHRYEDACSLQSEHDRNSLASTGSGTPVSSEYNTSDSDSECEFRQFQVQPLPPASTLQSTNNSTMNDNSRPFSLIFTRLTKIESEHRDELLKHVEELLSSAKLRKEYQQIFQKKMTGESKVANENMNNNRIHDVLPYDDHRITLNPNNNFEAVDYINASNIQYTLKEKHLLSFIVAQSPLKHTTNAFWQMVWEQNVTVIAMLSKLKEAGFDQCHQYWPQESDKAPTSYGQVTVRKNFENNFNAYSVRSFQVQNSSTTKSRTVFQLQYTQWPDDKSTPKWSQPFIEFLDEIQSIRKVASEMNGLSKQSKQQHLLVHCEDGAGRSGVVVMAEILLATMELNEPLDIPLTLAHLRSQRMKLVRTEEEYIFLHQLLADYLRRNRLI